MKKEQVEILSSASNLAVMRAPGRNYPGSLIQGDSLYSLFQLAIEAKTELKNSNIGASHEALEEIIELLDSRLSHYESVLEAHGIELPYVRNT
jgi:hypothetical protein